MDAAHDPLDESGEQAMPAMAAMPPAEVSPGEAGGAGDEPVLGPLGRRLLTLGIIAGVVILIVAMVWLMGQLAYTSPPVPGSG